ncbi:MAG TPA: porin [Casimicrobiaceae bacterium]|nr:porin [Casimicrobiaceae bacterium]
MNKKLVAVAVAGLLAAPLAAQAQNANVTLYGRLNIDLELVGGRQSPALGGGNPHVWRLSSNSSRLGVRGTEALGGGLNAIFQIEQNVSGDTGNSSSSGFASRETFVGLQGNWGTFKMGKFLMPLDDMHPIFGNVPTFTTSILSTADLWAQGTLSKGAGGFDARLGNSLRYDSPVWGGFNFSTQISLRDSSGFADIAPPAGDNGEHTAELRHAYVWGLAGFYNNGPLQVGTAYERNTKVRGPNLSDSDWTLTGAYNFGVIRPALVYEKLSYDTPTGDLKRDFWGISATAPIGPGVLYAFYGDSGNGKGSAATGERVGGLTKGSDTGSQQWEVSYSYPLSKRTTVYAGYVKLNNDRNAAYTFNINSYTFNTSCTGVGNAADLACGGGNGKPDGWVFGLIHLF